MAKVVLVVEDDPKSMKVARDLLAMSGFSTIQASDGAQGVEMAKARKPDLVLMDLKMPGGNGVDASRAIVDWDPEASIILITGSPDAFLGRKALEEKLAKLVVPKPFHFDQLEMAMKEVIKTRKPTKQASSGEDAIA